MMIMINVDKGNIMKAAQYVGITYVNNLLRFKPKFLIWFKPQNKSHNFA